MVVLRNRSDAAGHPRTSTSPTGHRCRALPHPASMKAVTQVESEAPPGKAGNIYGRAVKSFGNPLHVRFRKHNVFCLSLPSCISYFIYSCCLSNASLRVLKKSAKHMTGYLGGRERNHFLSERTQERTDAVVSLTLYNLKVKPTNLVISFDWASRRGAVLIFAPFFASAGVSPRRGAHFCIWHMFKFPEPVVPPRRGAHFRIWRMFKFPESGVPPRRGAHFRIWRMFKFPKSSVSPRRGAHFYMWHMYKFPESGVPPRRGTHFCKFYLKGQCPSSLLAFKLAS